MKMPRPSSAPPPTAKVDDEGAPFPDSLCHRCTNVRHVATRASRFLLCTALPRKYPPQPVSHCPAFAPVPLESP